MYRPTSVRARGLPLSSLLLFPFLLLTGCGGSDNGTDPDPDPDPDPSISVTVGSSALSIEQGQSGSATVSVVRSGGFSGVVTVTATGLPSGVTATPATLASSAGSGSIEFTAASNAAVGTTDVTLTATGQGVSAATTLQLEITEAPIGSFSIALQPSSVTIDEVTTLALSDGPAAAPDATVTVEITRESPFDGTVELSLTDVPNNLQVSFAESTVGGGSTSLTVEAMAGLAPGSYTVTVTGTAEGLPDATAELQVTVEESVGGGGGSLQVEICDASWFAYKDGDGPWTRVMAGGNGDQFSFDASSDRIGISWVQAVSLPGGTGTVPNVEIGFLARNELAGFQDPCNAVPGGKTVTGTVTGFGSADLATVHLGYVSAFAAPGLPSFSLEGVPEGPLDLLAVRASEGPGSGEITADRVLLRRDQDLADGTNLSLDLEGSESFALGTADLTLAGLGMGEHLVSVAFQSFGNLMTGGLATRINPGSSVTVPVIPADQRESGDLHTLLLSEANRTVYQYRADPDGAMLELGPELAAVDVSYATSGGAVLPSVTFTPQAEYDDWYSATFSQLSGFTGIDVYVFATGAYLDGGAPVLTVPDFSAVDGWSADWELGSGLEITWDASAVDGLYEFLSPEDGTTLRLGTADGTINP